MTGQGEMIGHLADGGLDAVAEGGDRASQGQGQAVAISTRVGQDDLGATGGVGCGPGPSDEAAIEQHAGRAHGAEQGVGDSAFIDRGRHDAPASAEAPAA